MDNNFSNNLKHLRIQSGLTQEELAKKIGKDYSTIGKWELGQRSPVMADVVKLADIFNVPLNTLVTDSFVKEDTKLSQKEILFNKTKDILSDSDWATIEFIMNKTIEEYEKNKNGG